MTNQAGKGRGSKIQSVLKLKKKALQLKSDVNKLSRKTQYEDLEHAELGLEIVEHALEEVAESKGKGGQIERVSDPGALKAAGNLRRGIEKLQSEARHLLKTHKSDEDLQTAIKAMEICKGSIEEVLERYCE